MPKALKPDSPLVFDYVVVGAGSAGCVVAEALSRDGRSTVAIIEAGGTDRRFFVQMPLGYGKTFYDRRINWNYQAEPDPAFNGRADFWPRGKLLGGSGSINAMVWVRGDPRDFDTWADEDNPGWAYRDVLPYFKALEDNEAGADEWRGKGGRIHISDMTRKRHPLADLFIEAGLEAGFPANDDFNGQSQEGIGTYQINTRNGWRMSSAKAFLRPALKRPNVRLLANAVTDRILFEGKRATGVEITCGGKTQRIFARREVVLCAGALNTPKLLQLSGIGPAAHLKSVGVDVLHDLPAVGHHMQDHVGINYVYRANVPTLNQVLRPWWGQLAAGLQFLLRAAGPLSLSLNQGGGFVRSRPELDRPNIQLYFQALSTLTAKTGTRPLLRPDPFPGFAIGMSNCRPRSRGSCLIASSSPDRDPVIRANTFADPADLDEFLEGLKVIRRIAAQPALARIVAEELAPGSQAQTDEELIADMRERAGTVYHPVGTCRMGTAAAHSAVDARLRVHGFAGLRVIDASVFPSITSGNTNAPVMMVAAKGADMILSDR